MKLVTVNSDVVLKQDKIHMERERDVLQIQLVAIPKIGTPYSPKGHKIVNKVGKIIIQFEKRVDPEVWAAYKEVDQNRFSYLLHNSLKTYYPPYYASHHYDATKDPEADGNEELKEAFDKFYDYSSKFVVASELLPVYIVDSVMECLFEAEVKPEEITYEEGSPRA